MSYTKPPFTIPEQSLAFFTCLPLGRQAQTEAADEPTTAQAWAPFINEQLAAWTLNPGQFADDDVVPPNAATIACASATAISLRDQGAPAPTRIVPTGDGGIAFQYDSDPEFISIEVEPEGRVELLVFVNGRLTHRAEL
ncbi:MAG TPA: hypothetical protein VF278_21840 [Pirellulales bacterium]